jgi:16S rRNA (cytosine967-C5)-methyltransferase
MRLHRNLVYTIDSLNAIFNEGEYADKVARALKKTSDGEL